MSTSKPTQHELDLREIAVAKREFEQEQLEAQLELRRRETRLDELQATLLSILQAGGSMPPIGPDLDLPPATSALLQLAAPPSSPCPLSPSGVLTDAQLDDLAAKIQNRLESEAWATLGTRAQQLKVIAKRVGKRLNDLAQVESRLKRDQQQPTTFLCANCDADASTSELEQALLDERGLVDSLLAGLSPAVGSNDLMARKIAVIRLLDLPNGRGREVLAMAEADFDERCSDDRLGPVKQAKMTGDEAWDLLGMSDADFKRALCFNKSAELVALVTLNSQRYGINQNSLQVEIHCPQMDRSISLNLPHYCKLQNVLYGSTEPAYYSLGVIETHIHPQDPKIMSTSFPVFTHYWSPLFESGSIPQISPDLKLFFSSPDILDGEWIQFHGLGAVPVDVSVGSLCDPNNKGSFQCFSSHFKRPANWEYKLHLSSHKISIKWEQD